MKNEVHTFGYCRRCGGKLDSNGKCTVCYAQSFTAKMLTFPIMLLLCVCAILFTAKKAYDINLKLEQYISACEFRDDKIKKMKTEIEEQQKKCDFLDEHIAIIVSDEDDAKYHKYGCYHVENKSFWAYNIELAQQEGHEPCKVCH